MKAKTFGFIVGYGSDVRPAPTEISWYLWEDSKDRGYERKIFVTLMNNLKRSSRSAGPRWNFLYVDYVHNGAQCTMSMKYNLQEIRDSRERGSNFEYVVYVNGVGYTTKDGSYFIFLDALVSDGYLAPIVYNIKN
jgi:hypothetical protein